MYLHWRLPDFAVDCGGGLLAPEVILRNGDDGTTVWPWPAK
jgi:hypothetical protein